MRAPHGSTTGFLSQLKLQYEAELELSKVNNDVTVKVTVDKKHHKEVLDQMIRKKFEPIDTNEALSVGSIYSKIEIVVRRLEQKGEFVMAEKLRGVKEKP